MASHSLAIAKASFAASLMRPDPTTIPRPEVARFHEHFDALLQQCSAINIQLCKDWLLSNITHSKTRTAALGKYFAATAASLGKEQSENAAPTQKVVGPPSRRRQLHILYLLNDLLHHVEYHSDSPTAKITLVESLPTTLLDIVSSASSHNIETFPKHHARVYQVLDIWAKQEAFHPTYIQKLRDTAQNAGKDLTDDDTAAGVVIGAANDSGSTRKDAPYVMPPSHGDPSIPFYDLPAGNMMPLIIPNSTAPIDPQSMKPLQFVTGPADAKLATVVDDFLKSVASLDRTGFSETEDGRIDIDELGQILIRNANTGEVANSGGYYGWSQAFCEKMKSGGDIREFGNDLALDRSSSRSRSPLARRRYSSAHSYSSNDRVRPHSRSNGEPRGRLRSRSISVSRSRSPPRDPRLQRPGPDYKQPPQHPQMQPQGPSPPPPPPPPFTQGFPLGPGGVPIPPRPAGYYGPWPPPPPPPMSGPSGSTSFPPGLGNQGFPNPNGWTQQPPAFDQVRWTQQTAPPQQDRDSSYGLPAQGVPLPNFQSNFNQGHTNRSNQHGGWAK